MSDKPEFKIETSLEIVYRNPKTAVQRKRARSMMTAEEWQIEMVLRRARRNVESHKRVIENLMANGFGHCLSEAEKDLVKPAK